MLHHVDCPITRKPVPSHMTAVTALDMIQINYGLTNCLRCILLACPLCHHKHAHFVAALDCFKAATIAAAGSSIHGRRVMGQSQCVAW